MMTRYGMLINTKKCVGCYACRTACQRQNGLPAELDFIRYEEQETGTYPLVGIETIPLQCMHCEDAPCAKVCPTGATYITDEGIVRVNEERCIGCKYCMTACPYQVRVQDHETGVVEKCRLCTVQSLDGTPMCSCVEACITGARIFGDLDDPESELSRAIVELNAQSIMGDLTKAKIFYVR